MFWIWLHANVAISFYRLHKPMDSQTLDSLICCTIQRIQAEKQRMNIQPEYVEMEEILRHVRSASIQCLRDMVTSGTARYHKTINSVSFELT